MFFSPVERIRKRAREAGTGKGSGTPLYVTGNGEVFDDSWQVLKLTGLGDVPEDVFQTLNYVIGPRTRSVTYSDLLKDEQDGTFHEFGKTAPVSWWQHFLWGISGFRRTVAWRTFSGRQASPTQLKVVCNSSWVHASCLTQCRFAVQRSSHRALGLRLCTPSDIVK